MSRWCDLPRPAWRVQRDGFKNVPIQPGGSRCCTHLMNISLITTHQTKHRDTWPLDSSMYDASKKYFDVVTSSLSSAWCACVLLMMPLHVPMSGQDPPLPPPVCEDPRRKNLRSIRGAGQQWKAVWKRMSYISAFKPAVNIGTNPMDFTLYSTVCCEFCKLLDHFRYQRPLLTKRLSGPSSQGRHRQISQTFNFPEQPSDIKTWLDLIENQVDMCL